MIDRILHTIIKLPNSINNLLLKLNILKSFIYGSNYQKYRKRRIRRYYPSFNNSTELLELVNDAINNVPYYHQVTIPL